jgi:hypothetical protein
MKPLSTPLAIALPTIINTAQIPNTLPQLVSKLFHCLHIFITRTRTRTKAPVPQEKQPGPE